MMMDICLQNQPLKKKDCDIPYNLLRLLKKSVDYVLWKFGSANSDPFIPGLGLPKEELSKMAVFFEMNLICSRDGNLGTYLELYEEHKMLVQLFLRYRNYFGEVSLWIAHLLATASLGDNHLWQDLGLESRKELGRILEAFFLPLFSSNREDMRWKKFFYRKLCEEEGIFVCKAPNCKDCLDRPLCYGPE
jgi:nitrogen fixation protein NifQ